MSDKEYKEITTERLDAITIEQWRKWAEKYDLLIKNTNTGYIVENTKEQYLSLSFYKWNDSFNCFKRLLEIQGIEFNNDHLYLEVAKAIHELIDEVEAM